MRRLLAILVPIAACTGEYRVGGKDDGPGLDLDSEPPDTGAPPAEAPLYAHTRDTLYEVEPTTGEVRAIGRFRAKDGTSVAMADLAIDLRGHLIGGAFDAGEGGRRALYAIDPTTAAIRERCTVDVALTAMTFLSDGRLVAGGEHVLTTIDLTDGCRTATLLENADYTTSGDIVGLPDGRLYWTVVGVKLQSDDLVAVDPDEPDLPVPIGRLTVDSVWGLGFVEQNGSLYGFTDDGRIVKIHPATGVATELSMDRAHVWWGATTNPVVWGE